MIATGVAVFQERYLFPELRRQIRDAMQKVFENTELERVIDDAVVTAVRRKDNTTRTAKGLFLYSYLIKTMASFTHTQMQKSLKEYK